MMERLKKLIDWYRGVKPEPKPWYETEHVGQCPFCGVFAWLPEEVKKGSMELVRCGRQKDGSSKPGHGCGRDLFA